MSYLVNAASNDGAISVPVISLEEAWAKLDELAAEGYTNIVIMDAGTGEPVRKGHIREP